MDIHNDTRNTTVPACADIFNFQTFTHYTCIPAACVILILTFLERRSSHPEICGGRPGLIIPFPLLDGYDNRFSLAAAFGAITNTIMSLFFDLASAFPFNFPLWAAALVIQLKALEAALTCFPLFACISTRHKMVGAVLGFLYSSTFLAATLTDVVQGVCTVNPQLTIFRTMTLLNAAPIVACYGYLVVKSVHTIFVCSTQKTYIRKELSRNLYPFQVRHVRLLLNQNDQLTEQSKILDSLLYRSIPGFKYPVRIICVAMMLLCVVYKFGLSLVLAGGQITHLLEPEEFNISLETSDQRIYFLTPYAFQLLTGVYYIVTIASTTLAFFYIYLFMTSYRRHILRMFRGHSTFNEDKLPTSHVIMANSLRFPGYQVAYMLWGYVILWLAMLFLTLVLVYIVYFLAVNDYLGSALLKLLQILSFPAMALLVFYLQIFLSKAILLQSKIFPSDENQPLNVNNRRFYECFNYYSLFGSLAIGIFSCFGRILKGSVLGICMVGRLDHSIYSRSWEHTDKGYLSYISMLHVENAHNHPVLRVFCHVLSESVKSRGRELEDPPWINQLGRGDNLASRRWHLAYTLLNNPELIEQRKAFLKDGNRKRKRIAKSEVNDSCDWSADEQVLLQVESSNLELCTSTVLTHSVHT